jgi:hypothetical protein
MYHISYYEPISEHIEIEKKADLVKGAESQLTGKIVLYR